MSRMKIELDNEIYEVNVERKRSTRNTYIRVKEDLCIYVTCNILIYEHEVEYFVKYVECLYQNGVDAIIVQDIGMLDYLHQLFHQQDFEPLYVRFLILHNLLTNEDLKFVVFLP